MCSGFCQIRDITSNPEWERAYQYEIPVLAKVRSDGTEVSFIVNFGTMVFFFFSFVYASTLAFSSCVCLVFLCV